MIPESVILLTQDEAYKQKNKLLELIDNYAVKEKECRIAAEQVTRATQRLTELADFLQANNEEALKEGETWRKALGIYE